jgi:hypothetical protein
MIDRERALNLKAVEIRQQLEKWAKERELLKSGEQLAFSMLIIQAPTVVQQGHPVFAKISMEMSAVEFFSDWNISDGLGCGVDSRVQNALARFDDKNPGKFTLQQIVDSDDDAKWMKGLGRTSLGQMERMLAAAGLRFNKFRVSYI